MTPDIVALKEKTLVGMSLEMSIVQNKTGALWGSFAPRIREISDRMGEDKYSLQVYPEDYFEVFNPMKLFQKWALVEVSSIDNLPQGMLPFTLEGGLYAVFQYKGSSADPSIFQYIYSEWIPRSKYQLDNRPHFEVLGEKYKNNDPNSEEEIWVPILEM